MDKGKIHLRGLSRTTLCGIELDILSSSTFAKRWSSVTCKRCMRTQEYKAYLKGKFREKPVKKSQTQGYVDLILENKNG